MCINQMLCSDIVLSSRFTSFQFINCLFYITYSKKYHLISMPHLYFKFFPKFFFVVPMNRVIVRHAIPTKEIFKSIYNILATVVSIYTTGMHRFTSELFVPSFPKTISIFTQKVITHLLTETLFTCR